MKVNEIMRVRPLALVCGLALFFAATPLVFAQQTQAKNTIKPTLKIQSIPNGAKVRFRGVVITRDADTFTMRDRNRTDYEVLLTGATSVKSNGGILRLGFGRRYPVADILRGLIVEVEGRGNSQGQLVADKIRFRESDLRAAITTDTRVNPVEENQERLSGQMDELATIAAETRNEVRANSERISSLDDYDVQEKTTVNFSLNSAVLSPEAKRQLDALAQKALAAKAYMVEVSGHADSTGSDAKNFMLSQRRAESVIQYLAVTHKIPVRRFITPMGFGETESVADNNTASGRAQNRRVEVKVLLNRGMSQGASAPSAAKQ